MSKEEQKGKEQVLYAGEEIRFLLRETKFGKKPILDNSPSSGIIVIEFQKKIPYIVLVRQFRQGCFCYTLEIPAGKSRKDENPLQCAQRELQEECGLIAKQWKLLYNVYPSVGLLSEKLHVFWAADLKTVDSHFDEDEEIEIEKIPVQEFYHMLEQGEVIDAKTMLAGFYLKAHEHLLLQRHDASQ